MNTSCSNRIRSVINFAACRTRVVSTVVAMLALTATRLFAQGYPLDVAVEKMTLAGGLRAELFAAEPDVRQPIFVKVDDRGRLWTIQYLQYPNPAGLERVSVDRWSRTVYDRIPEPPPHGPRGADRLTILEDTDGDGTADVFKDFLTGLNLTTGVEFGYGGVYVLQAPYLLFYPDRDRDDVPDADPSVLLQGFGMEDAQSQANHLTWGPGGWLYGVNGSTTTCNIRGVEFQQGVWRYHPVRDEFELFCEGGSNTFGLTFDRHGNLFYSTNGGPFVHAAQGAYYRKSFGKHGPLHNLYTYGFFETVQVDKVPGGPPTGGTIYLGTAFPTELHGQFIAGNFLGHTASWWNLTPLGSTVTAKYGGVLLDSHDTWFGPTDMCEGPNGAMYISDFHDRRTAHPDPDADWDLSNGRIYRIAGDSQPPLKFDLATLDTAALVELATSSESWFARRARMELASRDDLGSLPALRSKISSDRSETEVLQAVWALETIGAFDEGVGATLLPHSSEYVRMWAVRLLGDRREVSPETADRLRDLAVQETSAVVRSQLAASAKRLPAVQGIPILTALLDAMPEDNDPRVPWMIWWGLEAHAVSGQSTLEQALEDTDVWATPAWRMQTRFLIRRWAAAGMSETYAAAEILMASVPDEFRDSAFASLADGLGERTRQLGGIEQGGLFEQFAVADSADGAESNPATPADPLTDDLEARIQSYWKAAPDDPGRLRLALLGGIPQANTHLRQLIEGETPNLDPAIFKLVEAYGGEEFVAPLLARYAAANSETDQSALIQVLAKYESKSITKALLESYGRLPAGQQSAVIDVLVRRPATAIALFEQVADGKIPAEQVPIGSLRVAALHQDDAVDRLIRENWGNIAPGTPEQKLAVMRRFNNDLHALRGDPERGRPLFVKHCATCHVLFGTGNKVGPDLTTANRSDRAALLANIVDPGAVVRREYVNYTVLTVDGRVLTGLLAEQDGANITVLNAKNERIRVPRGDIEEIRESTVSLMPERILEQLTPDELRDLFAFLQQ